MDKRDYSRMRHALIQRGRRLQAAGLGIRLELPTARELKTPEQLAAASDVLKSMLEDAGTTVHGVRGSMIDNRPKKEKKPKKTTPPPIAPAPPKKAGGQPAPTPKPKKPRKPLTPEQRKRKTQRQYERRLKKYAEKYNLTDKQQAILKAARTLGIPLKPKDAKSFAQYLQYRYAMNNDNRVYLIEGALQDFSELPEQDKNDIGGVISDFESWVADRGEIGDIQGTSEQLWYEYLH